VKQRIAFFDFDGTITTKDTLLVFIRFSKGKIGFALGFLLNTPWLVAMKLKLISNQSAKQRVLRYFFGKQTLASFSRQCDEFAREVLPHLIRPKALSEIHRLKEAGATVVIVSASPENWINHWAEQTGADLIATRRSQVADVDRSQKIRTYNFQQDRVTDHRVQMSLNQLPSILAGELDRFIDALIEKERAEQLAAE